MMTVRSTLATSAREAAAIDPQGLAVADGATRWSWRDLDRRADAVAAELVRAGVGGGAQVGLLVSPSADAIAALHGIARAGAVAAVLPVNLIGAELAIAAVVTKTALVLHDSQHRAESTVLHHTVEIDGIRPDGSSPPVADSPEDAPAAVVLTSGTTGLPRAAVLSARAMVASAEAWLAALPPATGWLLAIGLAHVAGLGVVWRAALGRLPLVVVERPSPDAILAALRAEPYPSHVSLVPTTLGRLLELPDATPPDTLRAVPLGGGPIDPALVEQALAAGWPIVPTYGLTEAGSGVTALPTAEVAAHPASAGRPLPGVRIRIDEPDAEGIGEIVVDTPARFSGYLDHDAATAAITTTDPGLRTGDFGRVDEDGRLTVVDRRTDRIVRGGENVSPSEVEAVLRRHPAIADAAVIARPDPVYGQVPVAVVVVREGATDPTDEALAAHCREQLARFKVPVAFDRRSSLPRTASGKIRRAELRHAELRAARQGDYA
jgi:O-succinylbenzoic acid--CoA ligase